MMQQNKGKLFDKTGDLTRLLCLFSVKPHAAKPFGDFKRSVECCLRN